MPIFHADAFAENCIHFYSKTLDNSCYTPVAFNICIQDYVKIRVEDTFQVTASRRETMPINENTTWAEVGDISTGGSGHVRDAFKGSAAKKVLLGPTFKMYKFNEYQSLTAPNSKAVSPWWSPYEAYEWDGGWQQRKSLAAHLKVSMREFGRVTSAIKENWNSLSYLLVVEVKTPVYAYFGGFAQMSRIDAGQASKVNTSIEAKGSTKNLPGGGTQFYIPNLTSDDVTLVSVDLLS